jgi:hypothetical protein
LVDEEDCSGLEPAAGVALVEHSREVHPHQVVSWSRAVPEISRNSEDVHRTTRLPRQNSDEPIAGRRSNQRKACHDTLFYVFPLVAVAL